MKRKLLLEKIQRRARRLGIRRLERLYELIDLMSVGRRIYSPKPRTK